MFDNNCEMIFLISLIPNLITKQMYQHTVQASDYNCAEKQYTCETMKQPFSYNNTQDVSKKEIFRILDKANLLCGSKF